MPGTRVRDLRAYSRNWPNVPQQLWFPVERTAWLRGSGFSQSKSYRLRQPRGPATAPL